MTAYSYSFQDAIDALTSLGCKPTQSGDEWTSCCPVHEADGRSHNPSLSLRQGNQQALVMNCFAGCTYPAIIDALGLKKPEPVNRQWKIVATYAYHDAAGKLISEKVRYEPKDFRQRWPDGNGGWLSKKPKDALVVLYSLPAVLEAKAQGATVFFVEGEKDADLLRDLDLVATCNIEGASKESQKPKWNSAYTEQLTGCARLIIVPDNDAAGRAHAQHVAKQLQGKVADLRILELPDLPEKGDVSDWFERGGKLAEFLTLVEQADPPPPPVTPDAEHPERYHRPATVKVVAGGLPEATDDAEAALIQHGAGIYQRGSCLCRISHQSPATVRGITRPRGAVTITPLDRDAALDKLNRFIRFEKWSEKAENYKRCHAPAAVAMSLLARSGDWRFSPLISVINAPTLRPDGSVLEKPGYDPETGLFFDIQKEYFPPIPAEPSLADGQQAIRFLNEELLNRPCVNSDRPEDCGFSFAQSSDRSAALATLLTGLVRPSLPTAPIFLATATRPGSAKSLLADIPALIATGRQATIFDLGSDPDETEKRMMTILLAGDPVVNLDNLTVPLEGAMLCKVLTNEMVTGRLLGVNKSATLPTSSLFLATGNNVQVLGDMTRRTVVINLEPQSEVPENRQYDRNLKVWIPEHRPRLVQAGLTALRAYIVAGRPQQTPALMGSFEDWDMTVRQALIWMGWADPLAGTAQLESADLVRVRLRALLLAWYAVFKTAEATSKEAVARANEASNNQSHPARPLFEVIDEHFTDSKGNINTRYIGEFFKEYRGRVEIGARFEKANNYGTRAQWRVVIVDKERFQKNIFEGKPTAQTAQTAHYSDLGQGDSVQSVQSVQSPDPCSEILGENFSSSPLATRILEILSDAPGGMELADLIKTVGNAKGTSAAMVEMTVNQMLLSRQLGKTNGRLVVNR